MSCGGSHSDSAGATPSPRFARIFKTRHKRAVYITMSLMLVTSLLSNAAESADTTATANNVTKASDHFRRGIELFDEADYARALFEFERAYQAAPHFQIRYNLAMCQLSLKDYASALSSMETYVAEGQDKISEDRRTEVDLLISELRGRVGLVTILVNVAGARVRVGDRELGLTPLAPGQYVNIGRHRVIVEKDGYLRHEQPLEVEARQKFEIKVEIKPRPVPQVANADSIGLLTTAPPPPDRTAFWTTLGITGALGAGAVTTGILALSAKSDLDDALSARPGDSNAIASAQSRVDSFALATDILLISTAVSAGLTIFFWFDSDSDSPEETKPDATTLRLGAMPGGLVASGQF
jgi:hypothetical protein